MNPMEAEIARADQSINTLPPAMHHDPASARRELAAWDTYHREEKHAVDERHTHFYTAGRLLLAALFLWMAYSKAAHFGDTVDAVTAAGFAGASWLVGLALVLELCGGVLLAVGWQVRVTAGILIGYLVMVTAVLDWDQGIAVNRALAIANLGFVAALFCLAGHGPGAASLEKYFSRRRARTE
jgi:putative oxidoreductase